MATNTQKKQYLDQHIITNGQRQITAVKLNDVLTMIIAPSDNAAEVDLLLGVGNVYTKEQINQLLQAYDNTNRIINISLSDLGVTQLSDVTDIIVETYINSQEYGQAPDENLYFVVTENAPIVIVYNFDVTALDWPQATGGDPMDLQSFIRFLQNQTLDPITFTISDFSYNQATGRLMCNITDLTGLTTFTFPDKVGVTTINSLNIPVALLNFDYQQITNLTGFVLNLSTKNIYINNNSMTQTTYVGLEPWASSLPVRPLAPNPEYTGFVTAGGDADPPPFIPDLNMYFSGNTESIDGTALQSILVSKNINVIV